MQYILPLREDTVNVETEFYENNDDNKWDGVSTYNKRGIRFRKRERKQRELYYTFRDVFRKAELVGHFVEKVGKDYSEKEHDPKDVIREIRMGYFSFCDNLDLPAKGDLPELQSALGYRAVLRLFQKQRVGLGFKCTHRQLLPRIGVPKPRKPDVLLRSSECAPQNETG